MDFQIFTGLQVVFEVDLMLLQFSVLQISRLFKKNYLRIAITLQISNTTEKFQKIPCLHGISVDFAPTCFNLCSLKMHMNAFKF